MFFLELQNCAFIGGPAQEQHSCLNTMVNAASCSGFSLHLSGDEGTPTGTTPSNGNVSFRNDIPYWDCLNSGCKSPWT